MRCQARTARGVMGDIRIVTLPHATASTRLTLVPVKAYRSGDISFAPCKVVLPATSCNAILSESNDHGSSKADRTSLAAFRTLSVDDTMSKSWACRGISHMLTHVSVAKFATHSLGIFRLQAWFDEKVWIRFRKLVHDIDTFLQPH